MGSACFRTRWPHRSGLRSGRLSPRIQHWELFSGRSVPRCGSPPDPGEGIRFFLVWRPLRRTGEGGQDSGEILPLPTTRDRYVALPPQHAHRSGKVGVSGPTPYTGTPVGDEGFILLFAFGVGFHKAGLTAYRTRGDMRVYLGIPPCGPLTAIRTTPRFGQEVADSTGHGRSRRRRQPATPVSSVDHGLWGRPDGLFR